MSDFTDGTLYFKFVQGQRVVECAISLTQYRASHIQAEMLKEIVDSMINAVRYNAIITEKEFNTDQFVPQDSLYKPLP